LTKVSYLAILLNEDILKEQKMENIGAKKKGFQSGFFLIIGAAILGLAFLAARQFGLWEKVTNLASTDASTPVAAKTSEAAASTSTALQDVKTVDNSSAVGIQAPPEPVNGKVRSISMVGPSGVYNAIVRTDGKSYKLLKKAFTPKLINEQFVSTEDIKSVLEKYIKDSWNNDVKGNSDIQIVIASSVVNNPKIQAMIPDLKKTYVVTTTSSETEGAAAFKVAVAPQYQNTAFVMDVTPTIIRFTYGTGSGSKTIVAKTGSKYYQNNQTDEQALAEIRQAVAQIPRSSQLNCIVLWAAAEKDLREGENRYSAIPTYNGEEKSTHTGLKLINEVKNLTNANVVLDYESMWFMAY
jgi:hypothetical protein